MAALGARDHGREAARHPLAPGATEEAIREHLLREDVAGFERAIAAARASGGEQEVESCIEHWRRVAIVERDREAFTRVVRRTAHRLTGVESPLDEPLAVTRAKARM